MPSRAPWFHAGTGYWCSKINGRRVYLDRDQAKAQKKLNRLLAGQPNAGSDWLDQPFSALADEFLADAEARRAAGTFHDYSDSLARAFKHLDPRLTVGDVRKIHLAKVEQGMVAAELSPTSIFKTLHALQRVFAWAVETDLLETNPLLGYRKPRPRQRNRIVTPAEFRAMLRHTDAAFRRFLLALRLTGCRPGELRKLLWEHVDLEAGVWIIPDRRGGVTHKTASRQEQPRPRVIALTGPILRLCQWLLGNGKSHIHVFLSRRGKPWSATAVVSRLRRLRARAGIEPKAGEQVVLYSMRHTAATEAVGQVSDIELAEQMGHTTVRTLHRYVHINTTRLKGIADKIQRKIV